MITVFATLLAVSSAPRAACPTDEAKNEAALVRAEQAWVRAAEQHDAAALGCLLADEFEEADFDGSLISRATMLANAAKPKNGHSELTDLHVRIYGETAVVRGIGVNSQNGRPAGRTRFTDIFVYRARRWQCVAGHDSRFPNHNGSWCPNRAGLARDVFVPWRQPVLLPLLHSSSCHTEA